MCASGDATQHTIRRYTIRKIIKTEFLSPRVFIDFSYCVSRTGTISAMVRGKFMADILGVDEASATIGCRVRNKRTKCAQ
jgi:hypothetical protein